MIKAALIGAGQRGKDIYGEYALSHPHEIAFVAVAEPDDIRREEFAKKHNIKDDYIFKDYKDMLQLEKFCDIVFICTQDKMHYEPCMLALEKGYDVMLEKPMATDIGENLAMVEKAREKNLEILVAHVLRYTPFFTKVKELLDSKVLGEIININLSENVGYFHYVHSYVRGNWANSNTSSPMILAKSCHDLDLLCWLTESSPKLISSFGSLKHFKKEKAPKGHAKRCVECPIEHECPYSAIKIYFRPDAHWMLCALTEDFSKEGIIKALKEGPYGRCAYHCDNNVVDHQLVNIQFGNGVTANLTMCGFTKDISRDIVIHGSKGQIQGNLTKGILEVAFFDTGQRQRFDFPTLPGRHSGGDFGLMKYLTSHKRKRDLQGLTNAEVSVVSHIMAYAAEKARISQEIIDFSKYMEAAKQKVKIEQTSEF